MNAATPIKNSTEEVFYLTELLGTRAYFKDRQVGKLHDLAAIDEVEFAEVMHFRTARPLGDAPLMVPLEKVRFFDRREIVVDNGDPASYVRTPLPKEVLLRDYTSRQEGPGHGGPRGGGRSRHATRPV